VYDIAKELGIETAEALAKLKDLGEYVKSGSSTIAPPVANKLRAAYPNAKPKAEEPKVEKPTKAKAAKPETAEPVVEEKPEVSAKPVDPTATPEAKPETPATPAAKPPNIASVANFSYANVVSPFSGFSNLRTKRYVVDHVKNPIYVSYISLFQPGFALKD
jgi:translation initiation factor IF-2